MGSTVHVKCVTLWCVVRRPTPANPRELELSSAKLLEFEDSFREPLPRNKHGEVITRGIIRVAKVDGEPLYPWRRSELAAVTAYRERLEADMRALEDRLRRLEAARDAALGLLSEEGV
jgi:PHD/YefM family antitoxin component YafN of YafNO toxin-antitoxin module